MSRLPLPRPVITLEQATSPPRALVSSGVRWEWDAAQLLG